MSSSHVQGGSPLHSHPSAVLEEVVDQGRGQEVFYPGGKCRTPCPRRGSIETSQVGGPYVVFLRMEGGRVLGSAMSWNKMLEGVCGIAGKGIPALHFHVFSSLSSIKFWLS